MNTDDFHTRYADELAQIGAGSRAARGSGNPELEPRSCSEKAGSGRSGGTLPPVLDACCSIRSFWFDKRDPRAMFVDVRNETIVRKDTGTARGERSLVIAPDIQADFTNLPFPDCSFWHVVFDPPHKKRDEYNGGFLVQHYGILKGDWQEMLRNGFCECFRVLKPGGTLIFKWADTEFPLKQILTLTPEKPLYGHTRQHRTCGTHWVAFLKGGGGAEQAGDSAATQHSGAGSQNAADQQPRREDS